MGLAVLVGVAVRLWILSHHAGALDSDEAVVGLMARHILKGEFPVFFWGQHYGGSLEAFVTAPLFAVFGAHALVLKLVPAGFDVAAAILVWRVGKRTVGLQAAVAAALVFWVWPAAFVWSSIKARGFYGVALALALAIILLAMRLQEHDGLTDWLLLGLALGLGWWATPEIVFVAAPVTLWLAVVRFRRLWRSALAVPGAVLGASPWIVWNVQNSFASLHPRPQPVPHNGYVDHLVGFFKMGLPGALSLRIPLSGHWVAAPVGKGLYVAGLVGLTLVVVWKWRKLGVLLLVLAAYPLLFALSPYSWYVDEPRYLLLLSPILAILAGAVLVRWQAAGVALLAMTLLTVVGIRGIPPNLSYPQSFGSLEGALRQRGIDRAFADYWVAYRLTFETEERIIASPTSSIRNPALDAAVRERTAPSFIFFKGTLPEYQFVTQTQANNVPLQSFVVGQFVVYSPGHKMVPPLPGQPDGPVTLAERPAP